MKKKHYQEIERLTKEVSKLCDSMPTGKWLMIQNRLRQIRLHANRITPPETNDPEPPTEQTSKQIADRYIAQQAVLQALIEGEHVTMKDAARFGVCDMHTTIARVRETINRKNLPYTLESRRITFGNEGKVCKEYWISSTTNES